MVYYIQMVRLFSCLVLLASVLAACDLQQVEHSYSAAPAYKNPHTLCARCHGTENPQPGGVLFKPGTDPSALCDNCHDYKQNHHPVDFVPADSSGFPLPLFSGQVRCLTCHEIHGGTRHEGTPKLLRGGPYAADRRASCFRCHSKEKYEAIDPHLMLDDAGKVRIVNGEPVCLLCHSKMPNPAVDRTEDVKFRADPGFLCWRCHPPMPDAFFDKHFLVKPSATTLQRMRVTEERLIVIFPLVPRGRITCSTCHNPHQKGVLKHEAAAKGADAFRKVRLPSLCFGCHRM